MDEELFDKELQKRLGIVYHKETGTFNACGYIPDPIVHTNIAIYRQIIRINA